MTLWLSRVLALCLSRESPPSVWRLTCYFVDALLVATDRNRPERLSHSLLLDCLAYYLGVTRDLPYADTFVVCNRLLHCLLVDHSAIIAY